MRDLGMLAGPIENLSKEEVERTAKEQSALRMLSKGFLLVNKGSAQVTRGTSMIQSAIAKIPNVMGLEQLLAPLTKFQTSAPASSANSGANVNTAHEDVQLKIAHAGSSEAQIVVTPIDLLPARSECKEFRVCPVAGCDFKRTNYVSVDSHIRQKHTHNKYICIQCNHFMTTNVTSLRQHRSKCKGEQQPKKYSRGERGDGSKGKKKSKEQNKAECGAQESDNCREKRVECAEGQKSGSEKSNSKRRRMTTEFLGP